MIKFTRALALTALLLSLPAFPVSNRIEISVGFENSPNGPFGLGVEKWKELLEERSDGTMTLSIFPNSLLGNKDELLDLIAADEPVCTAADGADLADRGAKDMAMVYAPYMIDSWEQAFRLHESEWFEKQRQEVLEEAHLKIISYWKYGVRHTLHNHPVTSMEDLRGLRIGIPTNVISAKAAQAVGAQPVPLPLEEVYTALENGTIDGVENSVTELYNSGFTEVAKFLLLDGHVYNFINLVVGESFWNSLSPKQQKLLTETCEEAGSFQNELVNAAEAKVMDRLRAEGVTVFEPSEEFRQALAADSQVFYSFPEFSDWSEEMIEEFRLALRRP